MASGKAKGRRRGAAAARQRTGGSGTRDGGGVVVRFEPFYRVARRIPRGRVATYGQVAALAGRPHGARLCGYALSALRNTVHDVPWQRVMGARGAGRAGISLRDPMGAAAQQALLEEEGVVVDARGRVELARFGWRAHRPRQARGRAPDRRTRGAPAKSRP